MTKAMIINVLARCENVDEMVGAIGALVTTGQATMTEVLKAIVEHYETAIANASICSCDCDCDYDEYEDYDDCDEDMWGDCDDDEIGW